MLFPINVMKRVNNHRIYSLQRILSGADHYIARFNKPGYPKMKQETRLRLEAFFTPYNKELEMLTGINWHYCNMS